MDEKQQKLEIETKQNFKKQKEEKEVGLKMR